MSWQRIPLMFIRFIRPAVDDEAAAATAAGMNKCIQWTNAEISWICWHAYIDANVNSTFLSLPPKPSPGCKQMSVPGLARAWCAAFTQLRGTRVMDWAKFILSLCIYCVCRKTMTPHNVYHFWYIVYSVWSECFVHIWGTLQVLACLGNFVGSKYNYNFDKPRPVKSRVRFMYEMQHFVHNFPLTREQGLLRDFLIFSHLCR